MSVVKDIQGHIRVFLLSISSFISSNVHTNSGLTRDFLKVFEKIKSPEDFYLVQVFLDVVLVPTLSVLLPFAIYASDEVHQPYKLIEVWPSCILFLLIKTLHT